MTKTENNTKQFLFAISFFVVGVVVSLIILFDTDTPTHYCFLPVLPLTFGFFCMIFLKNFSCIPSNLGVTVIFCLLFIRNVLTPLLMVIGAYKGNIYLNIEQNTTPAIWLIVWETFCVLFTIYLSVSSKKGEYNLIKECTKDIAPQSLKKYFVVVITAGTILLVCDIIAPELMDSYRTIFDIGNEHFANFEDTEIVRKYGTTFVKKLAIVLGRYICRALILIFPAWIIMFASTKYNYLFKLVGFFACFIPLFYIAGGIARSLIYVVCLLLLFNYSSNLKISSPKQIVPLVIAGGAVIAWWLFIGSSGNIWETMSARFNAYFSGVNIVSGGFNLPKTLELSIRYFINDFTSTIPFGGTIFGISYEPVQSFFNSANQTAGQIPPTISMGNYYFGPLLAPIYSIIFTILAVNSGKQLFHNKNMHPMKYIRLLISVFQFSMGIAVYNIEITMTAVFSLILPMYIIEKITDKREN